MSIFDLGLWNGLGGFHHGSLFCVSDKVDTSQPPGVAASAVPRSRAKQPKSQMLDSNNIKNDHHEKDQGTVNDTTTDGLLVTTRKIFTGEAFFYSPNLTWFLMAVGVYYFYPYDLDRISNEQQDITTIMLTIFWERLVVHHVLAMSYISFWHGVLYVYPKVCHRPFVPNRTYNIAKVVHNVFYTWLGVLQWTATEVAFIYCYKTGRLVCPNVDQTNTSVMYYWTTFLVLSILLPSWRDVHFYFCHRLIHLRFLYKYIHGLHHRNTDIEPFSGLCMHPVEHLYYYTCYAPILVLGWPAVASALPIAATTAPFLLFWMGLHVVITPAASHSGYEDHFSADLAHYLHHRYCECNYGAGINFDAYFGTYEATLRSTKGKEAEGTANATATAAAPLDPKATLVGWMPEHPLYQLGYLSLYAWVFVNANFGPQKIPPMAAAVLLSFGPALWALVLSLVYRPSKSSWRKLLLAPFDKDSVSSLTLHLGLGVALGVLPSTVLFYLVLS